MIYILLSIETIYIIHHQRISKYYMVFTMMHYLFVLVFIWILRYINQLLIYSIIKRIFTNNFNKD
uniref:TLC domain-containing protein n=1 Tax=Heterorhabditis bacteriophora TaxID=37862 RepID=A0A1I7W8J5_HETBA